ncbi:hypothetical protein Hanom_Chr05g00405331 [Helianthus anomalus]
MDGSGVSDKRDNPLKTRRRESLTIWPEDTLGDIHYKSYDDGHANEIHALVWKRVVYGSFSPGEVYHQRDRGHDALYRAHVFAQANFASTRNQITREWRTMYLERSSWEKHRERLAAKAKLFEQAKAQLAREKEAFEQEKRPEEWGHQGLKKKLQESEYTLTNECRKWHVACDNDNKKMFAARTKITNLEARVKELKKSEADFKDRHKEAKSHRERVEIIRKDRDLANKDAEIVELKHRLCEAQEGLKAEKQMSDSLEIDLGAEKVRAESAEEARKVSLAALNVAQENYAEV